ncbi:MAG: hypothetical protein ACRDSR_10345 [Pseudonocardiaceae bacterium]
MQLRRMLVVAGVLGVALLAPAGGASAAETEVTMRCPGTVTCVVQARLFPGGTIAIDVETIGPRPDLRGQWQLTDDASTRTFCKGQFTVGDPRRSWLCENVPAGPVTLFSSVASDDGAEHLIGLRY